MRIEAIEEIKKAKTPNLTKEGQNRGEKRE
jgi:hypothetical protein